MRKVGILSLNNINKMNNVQTACLNNTHSCEREKVRVFMSYQQACAMYEKCE